MKRVIVEERQIKGEVVSLEAENLASDFREVDASTPTPSFTFTGSVVLSTCSTTSRVLSGLVISKAVAVLIGPAGLAIVGQFQNFASIFTSFSQAGISTGVTRYIAESGIDVERQKRVLSTAFVTMTISTCLMGIIIVLLRNQLSAWLLSSKAFAPYIGAFAATLFFSFINQLLLSALNGFKQVGKLTLLSIVGNIVSALLTYVLSSRLGVRGALLSIILSPIVVLLTTVCVNLWVKWIKWKFYFANPDRSVLRSLIHYTAMALATAITLPISSILIRRNLANTISITAAGYWQGIWRISDTYLLIITSALAVYYLPRLSELNEPLKIRHEVFVVARKALPAVIILATFMYMLRDVIIRLLFASSFSAMRDLFAFQMIGDCLKIASWLLSYIMVAKAMTRMFIATEIVFSGSFVILAAVCTRKFGLVGVSYAFAINYACYLLVLVCIFWRFLLDGECVWASGATLSQA